jgi:SRSO17 transposase
MLGKQDNCQVAVSVTLACQAGSLPVAGQLYLPQEWAVDRERREKAGVPQDLAFATKPAIALVQIERLMAQGAPRHCVLADAGYGIETVFRERLSELGLPYVVGVTGQVTVWPPGHAPLPPEPYSGRGNVPTRQRLGNAKHQRPPSVKELAFELDPSQWQTLEWREGTNFALRSRFARVRVHAAHRDHQRSQLRPQQWLLIEWPEGH